LSTWREAKARDIDAYIRQQTGLSADGLRETEGVAALARQIESYSSSSSEYSTSPHPL